MKSAWTVKQAALATLLTIGTTCWLGAQSPTPSPDQPEKTRRPYQGTAQAATPATTPQKVNKASSLIGMNVRNQTGEKVGTIKDIVVDLDSGRIAYCVLATDQGVFHAEKLHAVPLNAFRQTVDGESLTLNVDREKLAQAEGFNQKEWPSIHNPSWGAEPFWKEGTDRLNEPSQPDRLQK